MLDIPDIAKHLVGLKFVY